MSQTLARLGRLAARRPWIVIGAWVLAAVLVTAMSAAWGRTLEDPFDAPGLDSSDATVLLERAGAGEQGLGADVVVTPADPAGVERVRQAVTGLPNVLGTTVAASGDVALVRVQYPERSALGPPDLSRLDSALDDLRAATDLRIESGGDLYFAFDDSGGGLGEGLGLLIAIIVLFVAFGSLVAVGLPIGTALLGLAVGAGSLSLVAHAVDVPAWSVVIGSMVGLGVGIDYSLFVLTRYRELLADGRSVEDAVGGSLATAGRSVVFAGGTVVVAILGLAVARIPFITAGGIGIAIVVLVMVLSALTLLPALLGLAGHRVNGRRALRAARTTARWHRWGRHVGRHATAYALGSTAMLLALAAPVTALTLGFPDQGTMPQSTTERRAYDLVADSFGPGANGPIVVAVDLAGDAGLVGPLSTAVAADPGIAAVAPPEIADGVAVLVAQPTTSPQSAETRATIDRLRSEVLPSVVGGTGASAHVGGQVAVMADLGHRIQERLPAFITVVVLLSVLLLLVMFRSVLVPLKAAVLNLLSVGAAYGVLVMVFQWGWGGSLIGLESTVPILSFIPLFMFAILFGLSMDYEVFLLSRIREEYDATGDNDAAVARGLAGTARVISCAALIMVAVFGGFVLAPDPLIKMMGLGLATAIAVDATVVRLVLVPATMTLLGRANWWLPAWLGQLLPGRPRDLQPALAGDAAPGEHVADEEFHALENLRPRAGA
ncbi:MMPL family transporter [Nocardioides soli]|uniref:RND superfamily putative drug exporter n=1 Tax=Nocardioides soli TaxID=1036020 RepID=A0A7W4W088_9ACTN|nr:MMPL family transporter [Nocardioides soli]MBB3044502.1 RND superfamily putative drug exporter [Nocardioides soli]